MQFGFLCLETGITGTKNTVNVAMKNIATMLVAIIVYWAVGYGLMFGLSVNGWVSFSTPLFDGDVTGFDYAVLLFETMFCGTAASIVSGAVAERMRFWAFLLIAILVALVFFPLVGHWSWNHQIAGGEGGWLENLGFVDWAGATVVHSLGGWVALATVIVIGPRIGRFQKGERNPREFTGANLPVAILGVFFFILGWIGFNGGNTFELNDRVPGIIFNTILAAAAGGIGAMALNWSFNGKPRVLPTITGVLTGLVSITASAHAVAPISALLIGAIGGVIGLAVAELLLRLRIDDVVAAIPIHLGGGIWGTFALALFSEPEYLKATGRLAQLAVQGVGVFACFVIGFVGVYAILRAVNAVVPLRVTPEHEAQGLNVSEHGEPNEIYRLVSVMAKQADTGDLSQRVEADPFTEIGQIGGFYNQVVDAQEKLTSNLESRVSERTRQLQKAKLEAEKASRSKSEFLANMSHEFRTPLNAIIGFAAMIEGAMVGPIERKYQEYAGDIRNSGKHLMELLSDILDLSKVEAGKLDIDEQEVDVAEVITSCADMVRLRVEEASLIMTTEFPPELPTLYADRRRLSQVLVNLMTNSIKFTAPGGRIVVSAEIGGDAGIVIAVSDTGIGIESFA